MLWSIEAAYHHPPPRGDRFQFIILTLVSLSLSNIHRCNNNVTSRLFSFRYNPLTSHDWKRDFCPPLCSLHLQHFHSPPSHQCYMIIVIWSALLFTVLRLCKHLLQLNYVVNQTTFPFWHSFWIFSDVKKLSGFAFAWFSMYVLPIQPQIAQIAPPCIHMCVYLYHIHRCSINFTFQKMNLLEPSNPLQSGLVALYFFSYLFIYFWLHWVFVAVRGPPPVAASRDQPSPQHVGPSRCGAWAPGSRAPVAVACGLQ